MAASDPLERPRSERPVALRDRAADNLRFIRDAMEGASRFTAVSGWGEVLVGLSALAAAPIAASRVSEPAWLAVWLGEATLAALITLTAMLVKQRRTGISLLAKPAQRFALGLMPPLAAGAALTAALASAGLYDLLPGVWLLLYGTAVVTGGAMSIRTVTVMGASFMALGALTLAAPAAWSDLLLATGFGGLHVLFGAFIWRRHGG